MRLAIHAPRTCSRSKNYENMMSRRKAGARCLFRLVATFES